MTIALLSQRACLALASLGIAAAHAQAPATADAGRSLAATCANCHGTDGRAKGEMRPLAGRPAELTVALMKQFQAGTIPATIMHQIAKGYTDEQIRSIAAYFATQKP